jgi:hypothetical protein
MGLLAVSRRWFVGIGPGDDAAIAAVLARDHPVYAGHPQTTLADLAAMIAGHPRDHGWDVTTAAGSKSREHSSAKSPDRRHER